LPGILARDRDARLYLSVHHDAPAYRAKLQPAMELLREWVATYGIKVEVYPSQARWTRQYLGSGAAMMPYEDGKPRESWKACRAKDCPQLFEGKLWKCSPLAYLGMQDAKYGLDAKWKPYLGYEALAADCSDAELDEFFAREEESHCGMCPARPEHFALSIPIRSAAAGEP
jgi:hypothetical protein